MIDKTAILARRVDVYTTDKLRAGDVVHIGGARVELIGQPRSFPGIQHHNGRTVYAWGDMPIIAGRVFAFPSLKVWTVQGNDLASWDVERGEIGKAEDAVTDAERLLNSHANYHGAGCTSDCDVMTSLQATLRILAGELANMSMPDHDQCIRRMADMAGNPSFDIAKWRAATAHAETLWPVKLPRADGEIARDPRWWDAAFKAYGV